LQGNHSLLAGGVVPRHQLLSGRHRLISQPTYQLIGILPCLGFSFADNQVKPNAKTKLATILSGCLARASNFLCHLSRRFAPSEIVINVLGCDVDRRVGGPAKIERRIWFLKRRIQYLCAANGEMISFEIHLGLTGKQRPPDREKIICYFVSLVVALEKTVSGKFDRITTRHDIDKQPAAT
jgi:hypothetical protein